jgi:hypothetical protein
MHYYMTYYCPYPISTKLQKKGNIKFNNNTRLTVNIIDVQR